MPERLLFITGHLAEPRLRQVLAEMGETPFAWAVRNLGVKVAALMTPEIIRRRIGGLEGVDRVILPGRVRGDLAALGAELGAIFERGPDEVKDLPQLFGKTGKRRDLAEHDCRIFAEIVEAPTLEVAGILERARALHVQGADVIDLGGLPNTPFPHLEEAVQALRRAGYSVSVDSGNPDELRRGAEAGAQFLLSLTEDTLDLAFETDAIPVLIPARHGDVSSLFHAAERLDKPARPFPANPILGPNRFGLTDAVLPRPGLRPPTP